MPMNYMNNDGISLNGVKVVARPYPPNNAIDTDYGLGSLWIVEGIGQHYVKEASGWAPTGSGSDMTVNALDFGVKGDGTTDDTAALQAAVDATPQGGVLIIPATLGAIRTSAPIVLLEQRSYLFSRYMMWTYRYASPMAGTIKALGTFAGEALFTIKQKTITGRVLDADGIRLIGAVGDLGAATGNVHGVLVEGECRDLYFANCAMRDAQGTGSCWEFKTGAGTLPPRGVRMIQCSADSGDRYGFRFNGVTDSYLQDLLAVSNGESGFYISNSGENTFNSCRSVFNGFHGFHIDGSITTGLTTFVAPATDRNGRDGMRITQTGTQPIDLVSPRLRRDGSSSTSSDYAGLSILGTAGNTVVPVNVYGGSCVPGVNDGGGGLTTPQHAIRCTYAQRLNIMGGDWWGVSAGITDAGNNTLLTYDPLAYFASGTIGAKARQAGTEASGRAAMGIIMRQEIGGMVGDVAVTGAPGRWYNDTGYTVTLSSLRAAVGTAPVGSTIELNVRLNGANNTVLSIPAGAYTSSVAAGPISVTNGSYVDVIITQVGSTAPGADLTVSAKAAW